MQNVGRRRDHQRIVHSSLPTKIHPVTQALPLHLPFPPYQTPRFRQQTYAPVAPNHRALHHVEDEEFEFIPKALHYVAVRDLLPLAPRLPKSMHILPKRSILGVSGNAQ